MVNGCTLYVAWLPSIWKSQYPYAVSFPDSALQDIGVRTVNIENKLGVQPELYFKYDGHPNPDGANAFAQILADIVRSNIATQSGMLP